MDLHDFSVQNHTNHILVNLLRYVWRTSIT